MFGILAPLAWRAWRGFVLTTPWRRSWAVAPVVPLLYAITDEVHQGFVAGPHVSAVDVGIDTAGALVMVAVVWLVLAVWRRRVLRAADSGSPEPSASGRGSSRLTG